MRKSTWKTYEQDLEKIVEKYKAKATEKTVGRADGNGISNVYSGEIEIRTNHTIHGGYYGFDRYCPAVITVGSNVDRETAEAISDEVHIVINNYLGNGNLTVNGNKVYDCSKSGTSFDTYGIGK